MDAVPVWNGSEKRKTVFMAHSLGLSHRRAKTVLEYQSNSPMAQAGDSVAITGCEPFRHRLASRVPSSARGFQNQAGSREGLPYDPHIYRVQTLPNG